MMGSSVHFYFNSPQRYITNFSTFLPCDLFWNFRGLLSSSVGTAFTSWVEADEWVPSLPEAYGWRLTSHGSWTGLRKTTVIMSTIIHHWLACPQSLAFFFHCLLFFVDHLLGKLPNIQTLRLEETKLSFNSWYGLNNYVSKLKEL